MRTAGRDNDDDDDNDDDNYDGDDDDDDDEDALGGWRGLGEDIHPRTLWTIKGARGWQGAGRAFAMVAAVAVSCPG